MNLRASACFLKAIHVVRTCSVCVRISVLFKGGGISLRVHGPQCVHLVADGHSGCFHLVSVMNNAAVNVHEHLSV